MSHTNHRRQHTKTRYNLGQQKGGTQTFGGYSADISGARHSACSTVFGESSKLIRRDRAGAKKFVHSRRRRADRDLLKTIDVTEP